MHEIAVLQGAVHAALEAMRAAGATRLTHIHLVLGASGHLTEDAARQYFALLTKDTPAQEAHLDISWEPAEYQCFDCLCRFFSSLPETAVRCPECGGMALELAHSEVCFVREIQVERQPVLTGSPTGSPTGTPLDGSMDTLTTTADDRRREREAESHVSDDPWSRRAPTGRHG
jgi:Zn finger protein HypA/HybF involved in hydrogenase expression